MCGRYALFAPPHEIVRKIASQFALAQMPNLAPRYNIAPTQAAPIVLAGERMVQGKWGWPQSYGRGLLINARSETAAEKPSFSRAWHERRCLVPASLFYEWQKQGKTKSLPFAIAPKAGGLFAMAGLWQQQGDDPAFVILTQEAQPAIHALHPRQPLIVARDSYGDWLSGGKTGEQTLLRSWRIGEAVSKVANDTPDLIEPAPEQEASPQASLFN